MTRCGGDAAGHATLSPFPTCTILTRPAGTVSNIGENAVLQKTLSRILGCALLLYGSAASAFTLIEIQEQLAPSSSITEATTLETQVQPIVSTIRMQMLGQRRGKKSDKVTQAGRLLASNAHADIRSDYQYLAAAGNASGGGGIGGDSSSLWISTTYNALENEF
jgi:hypothetical protein